MDQNEIITPHPYFRLFATANTVGLGDTTGLYHGTQQINQAQMDRWSLVATLNYLSIDAETAIVLAKNPHYNTEKGRKTLKQMVTVADLLGAETRRACDFPIGPPPLCSLMNYNFI